MNSKKLLTRLLAVILTGSMLLAACAESKDNTAKSPENASADNAGGIEETEAETEKRPDLPEITYDGSDFTILCCSNWSWWFGTDDFYAEEENGEPVNDAVFRRNMIIDERYNVKITELNNMGSAKGGTNVGGKYIRTAVTADDPAYDASLMAAYEVSKLAYENYVIDLNSLRYLDLTNPWWDQKANSDLTIRGMMFYSTGDISTLDDGCTFCILFNKKLAEDYRMDNCYDLVNSGTWTIDKLVEMASSISEDLNGDGKFDDQDLYGFCIWQDSMMGMINAAGEHFCALNDDGDIELTLYNERTVDMFNKYYALVSDRTKAYSIYHNADSIESMFSNNQVFLYTRYLATVQAYRNMDADFGILPYPKYDETQNGYFSTIAPYGCSFICVPLIVRDEDMSAIILEDTAFESVKTVTKAFYDITLQGKLVRDDDSSAMLDIIYGNRVFDLGLFYAVGDLNEGIMDCFRFYRSDLASLVAKKEKSAMRTLDKINEAFAAVTR